MMKMKMSEVGVGGKMVAAQKAGKNGIGSK